LSLCNIKNPWTVSLDNHVTTYLKFVSDFLIAPDIKNPKNAELRGYYVVFEIKFI